MSSQQNVEAPIAEYMLIGGERVDGPLRIEVRNPARPDDLVGTIVRGSPEHVNRAVSAAKAAQPAWAARTFAARAAIRAGALARLESVAPAGLDWITALRAPAIRALVEAGELQLSLFDRRDMAAITSPDYPGERLIVCRNGELAAERRRKRLDLLAATERDLAVIAAAVARARQPLRGKDQIGLKVGAVVNRHKMAKHFELDIGEATFAFRRKTDAIAAEAALDGFYVVRTNLPKRVLGDAATVGAYKSLAQVEQAFRSLKTVDVHLRPIFHWTAPRVRGHVLLCMLAYHVEHHMRARLAPMLYDESDHEAAAAKRASIVAKAERSDAANRKQTTGRTADGLPVHSFQTLLADLGTYCRIQATTALNEKYLFTLHTRPTPIQQRAFELLGINPDRTQ